MIRAVAVAALLAALVAPGRAEQTRSPVSGSFAAGTAPTGLTVVRYSAPISPATVERGFQRPSGPYAAGHRGVDFASATGQVVRAAADGRVVYAGTLAGRGLVVIAHADGVRTEYEPIRPAVRAGALVRGGSAIGTVSGTHDRCAPGRCLHWGARVGDAYIDPLGLLRPLGVVRLLPWTRAGG